MNLYGGNKADVTLDNGKQVNISQETTYPWNGNVKLTLNSEGKLNFNLMLRIPGWVEGQPIPSDLYRYVNAEGKKIQIKINGKVQLVSNYVLKPNTNFTVTSVPGYV